MGSADEAWRPDLASVGDPRRRGTDDDEAQHVDRRRVEVAEGYHLGAPGEIPNTGPIEPVDGETPDTTAGSALIHALIEAGGQDEDWLTQEQLSGQPVRIPAARYREHFEALPAELRDAVRQHWGEAPGEVFVYPATIGPPRPSA